MTEDKAKDDKKTEEKPSSKKPLPYCCMDCKERFLTYGEYSLHLKEVHGV